MTAFLAIILGFILYFVMCSVWALVCMREHIRPSRWYDNLFLPGAFVLIWTVNWFMGLFDTSPNYDTKSKDKDQ